MPYARTTRGLYLSLCRLCFLWLSAACRGVILPLECWNTDLYTNIHMGSIQNGWRGSVWVRTLLSANTGTHPVILVLPAVGGLVGYEVDVHAKNDSPNALVYLNRDISLDARLHIEKQFPVAFTSAWVQNDAGALHGCSGACAVVSDSFKHCFESNACNMSCMLAFSVIPTSPSTTRNTLPSCLCVTPTLLQRSVQATSPSGCSATRRSSTASL